MFGFSKTFLISFMFFVVLFLAFPQIDIWFSSLFFQDNEFYLKHYFFADLIYKAIPILSAIFVLTFIVFLFKNPFNLQKRAIVFVLLSTLLGPGMIVNYIFKDHFGRARPRQIIQFGGDKSFTPAFIISNQCQKNCSFTCGHAAAGFSFMALAFLFSKNRRKKILLYTALFGFLVGFVRIIQGGHFLSDVVFSFYFVYMVIKILYNILINKIL